MERIDMVLNNLSEKFYKGLNFNVHGDDYYYEIFKNPNKSEIKDCLRANVWGASYDALRYLAVKDTGEVYIFHPDITHNSIKHEVGISFEDMKEKNLAGVAEFKGNKLCPRYELMDIVTKWRRREIKKELDEGVWDFMERYYFDLSELR